MSNIHLSDNHRLPFLLFFLSFNCRAQHQTVWCLSWVNFLSAIQANLLPIHSLLTSGGERENTDAVQALFNSIWKIMHSHHFFSQKSKSLYHSTAMKKVNDITTTITDQYSSQRWKRILCIGKVFHVMKSFLTTRLGFLHQRKSMARQSKRKVSSVSINRSCTSCFPSLLMCHMAVWKEVYVWEYLLFKKECI